MSIIEENNKIIEKIERIQKNLKVAEIEEKLVQIVDEMKMDEKGSICNERKIFNLTNEIVLLLNRIIAINEITIQKNEALNNRIQQLRNMLYIPCCIDYMDMPLNNSIYVIALFYSRLYENYCENFFKLISLGLLKNINGRRLNRFELLDSEREIANELNIFLKYVKVNQELENLINLCKNINYNYFNVKSND